MNMLANFSASPKSPQKGRLRIGTSGEVECLSSSILLCKHFLREAKGVVRRRNTAIDGAMQQSLFDFVLGRAVIEGGTQVHSQFIGVLQRNQHCKLT